LVSAPPSARITSAPSFSAWSQSVLRRARDADFHEDATVPVRGVAALSLAEVHLVEMAPDSPPNESAGNQAELRRRDNASNASGRGATNHASGKIARR
jgi:hypothetical protein